MNFQIEKSSKADHRSGAVLDGSADSLTGHAHELGKGRGLVCLLRRSANRFVSESRDWSTKRRIASSSLPCHISAEIEADSGDMGLRCFLAGHQPDIISLRDA